MMRLAEEGGTYKYDVSFLISNFSPKYQEKFKRFAKEKGNIGRI